MITFILVSRNDNYEGKSIDRLKISLERNINNLRQKFKNLYNFEFLLGDWGSEEPITKEKLKIKDPSLKIFYFPKEVTNMFNSPFNEVHSLNFLIKNSNRDYVARLDQDIILGDNFINYIYNHEILTDKFYWSNRRDLFDNNFDLNQSVVNGNPFKSDFYKDAIGIILSSKKNWCEIKGYNENMINRNHMEHDLFERFLKKLGHNSLVNLGVILDCPFFHIYHSRINGNNRQMNNYSEFTNDENWGLEKYKHLIKTQ
jgi:hypothetical protein